LQKLHNVQLRLTAMRRTGLPSMSDLDYLSKLVTDAVNDLAQLTNR
jgi:hypothetical protein